LNSETAEDDPFMDAQLLIICILTFIIHLIGTLAYAARIAGVRTRHIAISFSLFNGASWTTRASRDGCVTK
jgi:hypothetical protein